MFECQPLLINGPEKEAPSKKVTPSAPAPFTDARVLLFLERDLFRMIQV